jgi:hypothetical protein
VCISMCALAADGPHVGVQVLFHLDEFYPVAEFFGLSRHHTALV